MSDGKYKAKALHTGLKYELAKVNTWYAITLNTEIQFIGYNRKNKSLVYKKPHLLMQKYVTAYIENLMGLSYELHYELSPTGRQHWHGRIQFTDKLQFYSEQLQVLLSLGSVCIKEIDDMDLWVAYCTKQGLDKYKISKYSIEYRNGQEMGKIQKRSVNGSKGGNQSNNSSNSSVKSIQTSESCSSGSECGDEDL